VALTNKLTLHFNPNLERKCILDIWPVKNVVNANYALQSAISQSSALTKRLDWAGHINVYIYNIVSFPQLKSFVVQYRSCLWSESFPLTSSYNAYEDFTKKVLAT